MGRTGSTFVMDARILGEFAAKVRRVQSRARYSVSHGTEGTLTQLVKPVSTCIVSTRKVDLSSGDPRWVLHGRGLPRVRR